MSERFLLPVFVILAISFAMGWHLFAGWFVRSQGILPGILLLVIIILLPYLIDLDPKSDR